MTVKNTDEKKTAGAYDGPKIDVQVRPIAPRGNLVGFASVTIGDSFKVDGFKICSGEKGMYVNMPSTKDGQGNWHDVCWPVTADFRKHLTDELLDAYDDAVVSMQASLDASLEEKKMIACNLFTRIEVGRGYEIKVVLNMTYQQFCSEWTDGNLLEMEKAI